MAGAQLTSMPSLPGLIDGERVADGVFRAHDSAIGALRLVRLRPSAEAEHEAAILRQLDDAAGMARLVGHHTLGDGLAALVTEYAEGVAIARVERMPWRPAVRIGLAVAKILGSIHARGIVHGGLRPSHVVLAACGPVLVGFDGAVEAAAPYSPVPEQLDWAAPECAAGDVAASPAIDVYSLAALVRAMVGNAAPRGLAQVLAVGLAPRPTDRYQTMAELSAALTAALAGVALPSPPGKVPEKSAPVGLPVVPASADPAASPTDPLSAVPAPIALPAVTLPTQPLPACAHGPAALPMVSPPDQLAAPAPAPAPAPVVPSPGQPTARLSALSGPMGRSPTRLPAVLSPIPAPTPVAAPMAPPALEPTPAQLAGAPTVPAPAPEGLPGVSALVGPPTAEPTASPRARRGALPPPAPPASVRGPQARGRASRPPGKPTGARRPGRAASSTPGRRPPRRLATTVATVLVMAAAVATWWLGKSPPPQANAAPEPGAETGAEPTLAMDDPLPALEGGAVTVDSLGDPFFTWVNPSPAEGDQYHWTLLATPDKAHLTGDVRLAVPRREFGDGPVCVEVRLVRDEKTSPDELRICEG